MLRYDLPLTTYPVWRGETSLRQMLAIRRNLRLQRWVNSTSQQQADASSRSGLLRPSSRSQHRDIYNGS